jgi:hypothetical protein
LIHGRFRANRDEQPPQFLPADCATVMTPIRSHVQPFEKGYRVLRRATFGLHPAAELSYCADVKSECLRGYPALDNVSVLVQRVFSFLTQPVQNPRGGDVGILAEFTSLSEAPRA